MSYQSWSVVFGEEPSTAKWNILGDNDASFNDGTGIGTGVLTGDKLASGNIELLNFTPVGNMDNSAGAYADYITFGNLTVPTWATSAIIIMTMQSYYAVTAVTTSRGKIKIGSDTGVEFILLGSAIAINTNTFNATTQQITLTATGTQSLVLQAYRSSGTGALRSDTNTDYNATVIYK